MCEKLGYNNFCSACKESKEENGELICRDNSGKFYGKPVSHVLLAPCIKFVMNDRYLYKAKRIDNGEWMEGSLLIAEKTYIICEAETECIDGENTDLYATEWYEINPSTICQYTGLTDKNDKKIWENDILKGFEYPFCDEGDFNYFAHVVWFDNCPAFGIYTIKNPKSYVQGISVGNTEFMEEWNSKEWEVIGNIFDNPELLEGE